MRTIHAGTMASARPAEPMNSELSSRAVQPDTAAARMSRLDELVYLADGLEPGRNFPERAALERLAFEDVAAAMLGTLRASIAFLESRGAAVAPQTLAALAVYEAAGAGRRLSEQRSTVCPT